jgi:ethanolamine utilization microcompartment shell protein EutS
MAETGAIRAGGAFVEISTKNANFMKGLNAAAAKLKAWGTAISDIGRKLALAGAAGAGVLLSTLKVFSDQGDALAKMSQRTGISVEALSELGYAAEQSGATMEDLEKSVRKMQQGLIEATDGSDEAAKRFTRLGLSIDDLKKMNPEQQFVAIATQLAKVEDPTLKAALAMELFGKNNTKLLPLLAGGIEGVEALRERARELGLTMSTDAATGAVIFGDNMADVWKQVKKVAFEVGASLAPALADLLGWFQRSLAGVIAWVKENRQLVVSALKVTLAITAAGAALVALGLTLKATGVAMGFLASSTIVLTSAFAAAKAAVLLLLTPVGALSAAFVALGAVVVNQSGVIRDVLTWLGGAFKALWEDAKEAFDGIKNALAAGDIGKAAAVFWAFLKLEWQKGINALSQFWFQFKQGFIESWAATVQSFAKLFISAVGLIKIAWANASEFISGFVEGWRSDTAEGIIEVQRLLGIMSDGEANAAAVQIESDGNKRQKQIADDAQRAREEAVRGVQEQFKMLDDEAKAAELARIDAMNDRLNTTNEELTAAQKAFRDAMDAARAAGGDATAKVTTRYRDSGTLGSAGDDGLIGELRSMSTKGIFNPRAIQSLQGSRENRIVKPIEKAIERMVGGQDEMVNILKRIERNAGEGMAFT